MDAWHSDIEQAFIEMNLYAFFDIQLYSNIYVGSERE